MINYNRLFDVAYSDTIPESVKDSILDNVLESIGEELNEDLQTEGSRCVGILETLAFSNMSCPLVNSIIDKAFAGLNEDFINEVSDAFIHKAAKSALEKRKAERFSSGSTPIGLKGVQREARIQHAQDVVNKTEAPKPSALDRLKGAVSKVKSWVQNNRPVGLSHVDGLKKERDERIKSAAEMGTGPKAEKTNNNATVSQGSNDTQAKPKRQSTKLTPEERAEMDKTGDERFEKMKAEQAEVNKRRKESRQATLQARRDANKTPEQLEAERSAEVDRRAAEQKAQQADRYKRTVETRNANRERRNAEAQNKQNASTASSAVSDAIKNAENPQQNKQTASVK